MNEDTAKRWQTEGLAAKLRAPIAAEFIGKLPQPLRRNAEKGECPECGKWHGLPAVHLDYAGHAAITDRLLEADPLWTWEPFALDGQGLPAIVERGGVAWLWIRLTIAGVTKPGVGNVEADKFDLYKELISDALRNGAMRFGLGLDLWMGDEAKVVDRRVAPSGPPCPVCQQPVEFNDEQTRHRPGKKDLPVWSCRNQACEGGGLRDRNDPSKGNWPWGSYDPNFFKDKEDAETGGELTVEKPAMPVPEVTGGFDMLTIVDAAAATNAIANLAALRVSEDQARSELEAYASAPDFAAGTIPQIRGHVNRAVTLCVALELDHEGLLSDLFTEWQGADESRRILTWSTAKAHDVLSFAKHVQGYLRNRLVGEETP